MKTFFFGHKDDDDTEEEIEEMKSDMKAMLKMARTSRRRMLKKGDQSREQEHPLQRINDRISFAMGKNQEECEKIFGEEFFEEHSFTDGSLWWLAEMSDEQRIFLLMGVMMSICDAEIMIDMINDLNLDEEIFMEAATSQMEHLKEHKESIRTALVEAVEDRMDTGTILDEAGDILSDRKEGGQAD